MSCRAERMLVIMESLSYDATVKIISEWSGIIMKKYGKKWRKLEAERKIRKEHMPPNTGEPFSKARKKKILCLHYNRIPGLYATMWPQSLLVSISEKECMCRACKKRFPIEKYAQMEELINHLSLVCEEQMATHSISEYVIDEEFLDRYSELSQGLEPVYYRRLSETENEILEAETEASKTEIEAWISRRKKWVSEKKKWCEEHSISYYDWCQVWAITVEMI